MAEQGEANNNVTKEAHGISKLRLALSGLDR